MKRILTIKPAIPPEKRHVIENALKNLGYDVYAGGTDTDMSSCDISFDYNCRVCKVEEGENHLSFCSAGKGAFK